MSDGPLTRKRHLEHAAWMLGISIDGYQSRDGLIAEAVPRHDPFIPSTNHRPPHHPPPLTLTRMSLLSRRKRGVTAGVRVILQAIKDTGDIFPPVKLAAPAVIVVWEMSRVSTKVCILRRTLRDCFVLQRTRSNRKDCEHLADRAAEIVQCIWAQTKHYRRGDLFVEVEQSINRIARSVSIYGLRPIALS